MAGCALNIRSDSPALKAHTALSRVVTRKKHLVHGIENSIHPIEFLLECGPLETRTLACGEIAVNVGQRAAAVDACQDRAGASRQGEARLDPFGTRGQRAAGLEVLGR